MGLEPGTSRSSARRANLCAIKSKKRASPMPRSSLYNSGSCLDSNQDSFSNQKTTYAHSNMQQFFCTPSNLLTLQLNFQPTNRANHKYHHTKIKLSITFINIHSFINIHLFLILKHIWFFFSSSLARFSILFVFLCGRRLPFHIDPRSEG